MYSKSVETDFLDCECYKTEENGVEEAQETGEILRSEPKLLLFSRKSSYRSELFVFIFNLIFIIMGHNQLLWYVVRLKGVGKARKLVGWLSTWLLTTTGH